MTTWWAREDEAAGYPASDGHSDSDAVSLPVSATSNVVREESSGEGGSLKRHWDLMARYKYVFLFIALLETLATGGVIFGWVPLQFLLRDRQWYMSSCSEHADGHEKTRVVASLGTVCEASEVRLVLLYVLSVAIFSLAIAPAHFVIDNFGPRFSVCGGSFLAAVGSFVVAYAGDAEISVWYTAYGLALLSAGGPLIVFSFMHIAHLFSDGKWIATLLNLCLDGSCLVFVMFTLVQSDYAIGFHHLFFYYAFIPLFVCISGLWLWPSRALLSSEEREKMSGRDEMDSSFLFKMREEASESTPLLGDGMGTADLRETYGVTPFDDAAGLDGAPEAGKDGNEGKGVGVEDCVMGMDESLRYYSVHSQMRSMPFVVISLFFVVQTLQLNFYLATAKSELDALYISHVENPSAVYVLSSPSSSSSSSSHGVHALSSAQLRDHAFTEARDAATEVQLWYFAIIFPLVSMLALPVLQRVFERCQTLYWPAFGVASLSCFFCALNVLHVQSAVTVFVAFAMMRTSVFAFASHYIAKVFGFDNFPQLWAACFGLAGVCTLLVAPLVELAFTYADGNFAIIHCSFAVVDLICLGLPVYLFYVSKREVRDREQNVLFYETSFLNESQAQ